MITLLSLAVGTVVGGSQIISATTVTAAVVAEGVVSGATAATAIAIAGETLKGVAKDELGFD